MKIQVKTEDADGNVTFEGTLNKQEVELVLNVGINFLMANGVMPLFTGKSDEELGIVSPQAPMTQ
jgi:hypothetical protein